jgi:hypothetical protein
MNVMFGGDNLSQSVLVNAGDPRQVNLGGRVELFSGLPDNFLFGGTKSGGPMIDSLFFCEVCNNDRD